MLKNALSRRMLIGSSGKIALSAVTFAALTGGAYKPSYAAAKASSSGQADIDILNAAAASEYEAIAAYQVGAESGLLKKPSLDLAVQFQGHHKAHVELLTSTVEELGGKAVSPLKAYHFPVEKLKNQNDVLRFAASLEEKAASAYLSAVRQFNNRDLSGAAASIMGDETMHLAALLFALGENPVPHPFIS